MSIVKPGNDRIAIVETIRGLAALAVCLFHFTKGNVQFLGNAQWYQKIATHGWIGVEAFFVLSGFIIPYSLVKSGYRLNRFLRFFGKRCLRIEPPYLVSIALVLLLGYVGSKVPGYRGEPFQLNWPEIWSHIAYLPKHLGYDWILPVYWSLEAEFHFYILIGLSLPFLWKTPWHLVAGMVIALAAGFVIPLSVFSYAPLFVMGIAVCAYKTGRISREMFWGLLILSVGVSFLRGQEPIMPITGLVTALAIVFLDYTSPVTAFLGKISYSLYLIHVPIGGRIINLGGRFADSAWKVWALMLVALIVTLVASWIFYRLVEWPAQKLSKRIDYR